MKKKIQIIAFFSLFALPIPVALLGTSVCAMWFAASVGFECFLIEILYVAFGIIGLTYLVTYIYALIKTCKSRAIVAKSFLPLAHCLLALMYLLTMHPVRVCVDM